MKSPQYHKKRWLIQAVAGLIIIGFGLCLVVEAAFLKHEGAEFWTWVGAGTIALIVFNTGISLFVDSAIHKMKYDLINEQ